MNGTFSTGRGPVDERRGKVLRWLVAGLLAPLLLTGGFILAHGLVGGILSGMWQHTPPPSAGAEAVGGGEARTGQPRPCCSRETGEGGEEDVPALLGLLPLEKGGGASPGRAREWAEAVLGAAEETCRDPLPPPPGARRLFRLAGGYTFYRLPAGSRLSEAVSHYLHALAQGGWRVLISRPTGAGGVPNARHGRGSTPGHILLASRSGRGLIVFLHRRAGLVRVVVRLEPRGAKVAAERTPEP